MAFRHEIMSFTLVPLPSIFPRIYRHREQLAVVVVLFLNTKHWKSFDKFEEILTKQHLQKKFFIFLALPNIIPLLFYSNHTTNDIFIILYYNVGIFWQIAAVTYTIGPYWILDDLIIIYYLSSSQSILCVLPKLLSAAIIKMAWQNDCKKSSTILTFLPAIYQIWKTGPGSLMGSPLLLLRLLLPFAAAAPSCVLTPPRSIIESPTASKIPPPVSWKVSCSTFRSGIPRDKEAELCGSTSAP